MSLTQTFEEHKAAFGILGFAGIILIFLLLRGGSKSAPADPVSQILGYNEQQNQLNAQYSLQQQQIAAQQDATDQAAAAQQAQYSAAESTANTQTNASLIANLYDTKEGAQVSDFQTGAEENVENTQTNDSLQALESEYNSSDYQANLTAQLYNNELTDTTGLDELVQGDNYNLQKSALTASEEGKYSGGGEGGELAVSSLEAILGESGAAGEGELAGAQVSQGTDSLLASIIASISNFGKSTVTSLFA